MLRSLFVTLLAALFLPLAIAEGLVTGTIWWPVLSPTPSIPWVKGKTNTLAWRTSSGMGVEAFDVELHHWSRNVMNGAMKIAFRVPMKPLPGRYGQMGGEIGIDLEADVPAADGYVVSFVSYLHGQVFAISEPFSIVEESNAPSNYTDRPASLTKATVTATLDHIPNPTEQWPLSLSGKMEPRPTIGEFPKEDDKDKDS